MLLNADAAAPADAVMVSSTSVLWDVNLIQEGWGPGFHPPTHWPGVGGRQLGWPQLGRTAVGKGRKNRGPELSHLARTEDVPLPYSNVAIPNSVIFQRKGDASCVS